MAEKIIETLANLKYNEQITLAIVETDEDLNKMFMDETKEKSFILLRQLVKENLLKTNSKKFLYDMFQQVICKKQELIDQYLFLENNGTFDFKTIKIIEQPLLTIIEPTIYKNIVTEKPKIKKKNIIEGELPKWYGKERILKDIIEQGGKSTPLQNAMLKVNQMKNIYANINARLIKDTFSKTKVLTDEDYRIISSVVNIMENRLKEILKKK